MIYKDYTVFIRDGKFFEKYWWESNSNRMGCEGYTTNEISEAKYIAHAHAQELNKISMSHSDQIKELKAKIKELSIENSELKLKLSKSIPRPVLTLNT